MNNLTCHEAINSSDEATFSVNSLAIGESTSDILNQYEKHLENVTQLFSGYPYNLSYNYQGLEKFLQFTINNVGDPYIPSNFRIDSRPFEREVIEWFANLYELDDSWGYISSSGTEGNLYGVLLGRETYPEGILYSSADTHYSVAKAARFFRMKHQVIPSFTNGEINYNELAARLDPTKPAIIVANIGTTFKGAIDDIDKILEILDSQGISEFFIHCDGALGGMLVPYVTPGSVTFKKQIHSLSISGHKFIGCPLLCGIVITHKHLVDKMASTIEYIASKDTTFNGSRNGHSAIFLWKAIQERAKNFEFEAKLCIKKAELFHRYLQKIGINSFLNPCSNIVVFPKPDDFTVKKYQLATVDNQAHVVVMQQHTLEFLSNLCEIFGSSINHQTFSNRQLNSLSLPRLPLSLSPAAAPVTASVG